MNEKRKPVHFLCVVHRRRGRICNRTHVIYMCATKMRVYFQAKALKYFMRQEPAHAHNYLTKEKLINYLNKAA